MRHSQLAPTGFIDALLPLEEWGESIRAVLGQSIQAFADASWEFIKAGFSAGSFTGPAQDWWIAIVGGEVDVYADGAFQHTMEYPGMLNVMVIAMLPILLIFVAFQVVMSVFRSSTMGMVRAFAMSMLAVPLTYVLGGLIFMLLIGTDRVSQWILEVGTEETSGDDVGVSAIFSLFGMTFDPNANDGEGGVLIDANSAIWGKAGLEEQPGQAILPWVVAGVLTVICAILVMMMLGRTVAILALTTFAPVAVFALAADAAGSIFKKWASIIGGLLLAKPVAASIVKLGITFASIGEDWIQLMAGVVLIIIAAAMPLLMLALVSFMTPESSRALEGAAVGSAMAGQRRLASATSRGGRSIMHGSGKAVKGAGRAATGAAGSRGGGAGGARGAGGPGGRPGGSGTPGSPGAARRATAAGRAGGRPQGGARPGSNGQRGARGTTGRGSGSAEQHGGSSGRPQQGSRSAGSGRSQRQERGRSRDST